MHEFHIRPVGGFVREGHLATVDLSAFPSRYRWSDQRFKAELNYSGTCGVFAADAHGMFAGYLIWRRLRVHCEVARFATAQPFQRTGAMSQMFAALFAAMKDVRQWKGTMPTWVGYNVSHWNTIAHKFCKSVGMTAKVHEHYEGVYRFQWNTFGKHLEVQQSKPVATVLD